jgi:hypothetical protein
MTRKKYERDTYHDEYTSDSSTTSEEPEEIDVDTAIKIIDNRWKHWGDTSVGTWADSVDLYEFLVERQPKLFRYNHRHLLLPREGDMVADLHELVKYLCDDLNIPSTISKVSQVVYHILSCRNKYCVIYRDDTHWTKSWSRKLREMERSF